MSLDQLSNKINPTAHILTSQVDLDFEIYSPGFESARVSMRSASLILASTYSTSVLQELKGFDKKDTRNILQFSDVGIACSRNRYIPIAATDK